MFASVASAGQAAAPQQTTASTPQGPLGTVQGKVLQEPGDQPIRKARVKLRSDEQESGENYSVVTDEEGRFKIDEVKPGL
jgi:Carboxypeptidase regulatory-like domain